MPHLGARDLPFAGIHRISPQAPALILSWLGFRTQHRCLACCCDATCSGLNQFAIHNFQSNNPRRHQSFQERCRLAFPPCRIRSCQIPATDRTPLCLALRIGRRRSWLDSCSAGSWKTTKSIMAPICPAETSHDEVCLLGLLVRRSCFGLKELQAIEIAPNDELPA